MMIIDTDILIDAGRGYDEAVDCLERISSLHKMAISSVTYMELVVGCRNKNELQTLDRFLHPFRMIRINEQISEIAVSLLKAYRLSHGLLIPDALIAATALAADAHFITKNQKDYRFIEGLNLFSYPLAL